jgi:hypothetical protein
MEMMTRKWSVRTAVAGAALMMMAVPGVARAQSSSPNSGKITFTGGVDVPSVYVFRGILQETDPKFTMWPYADLGFGLSEGDGAVKSVGLNIGVWHSIMTGSSGSDGPSEHSHYEQDFYATLGLGFAHDLSLATTYTLYTSPNLMFNTVNELSFKLSQSSFLSPYGLIAFELGDNGADGGEGKGTYLELGVGPTFPLGGEAASLTIPIKLGMSMKDYYELDGVDHAFGWFDIGAAVTVPLKTSGNYGSWNIHGGIDILTFGDTTKAFNEGDRNKVVGLIGIGMSY